MEREREREREGESEKVMYLDFWHRFTTSKAQVNVMTNRVVIAIQIITEIIAEMMTNRTFWPGVPATDDLPQHSYAAMSSLMIMLIYVGMSVCI